MGNLDRLSTISLFLTVCVLQQSLCFGQQNDIHPVMFELSNAIIGVQKALTKGEIEEILPNAEIMEVATGEMLTLEPQINGEITNVFNEYRKTIGNLASELVSIAKAKSFTQVPQVVQQIRHTCVSCHIMFRAPRSDHDLFPNTGNVIAGEVRMVQLDGKERVNRSNAVVFIDHVEGDIRLSFPRGNPSISQKNREFEPRVVAVVKESTVEFPNDDLVFHNVFSLSKTKPFDLDVYPPGESRSVTFNKTGWVMVYCNIHPKMVSNIIVLDNPYFSLTNERGLFVIPDVPDGEYTVRVWHEFGSDVRERIHVSGSSLYETVLEIQEDKKFVQHRNKFGKPYRGKYK